jgi:hypothetical protein
VAWYLVQFREDFTFTMIIRTDSLYMYIYCTYVHTYMPVHKNRNSSVSIATGYGLDDRGSGGFDSRRGLGIFLFFTASRPDLRPTQPPNQWLPGAFPRAAGA